MHTITRALFTVASLARLARLPWLSRRAVDLAVYLAVAEELYRR